MTLNGIGILQMKIEATKLKAALDKCAKTTGKKTTLPILSCIRMEATGGKLTIESSDLDSNRVISVDCDGDIEPVAINASRVSQFIARVSGDVSIKVDKGRTAITTNLGTARLSHLPSGDFPRRLTRGEKIAIDGERLAAIGNAMNSVRHAMSDDATRIVLNGVLIKSSGGKCAVVATDGRRMSVIRIEGLPDLDCIVPAQYAPEIANAMLQPGANLFIGENSIAVTTESDLMQCKLVDGTFPNFEQVIPRDTKITNTITDHGGLLALIESAIPFTSDKAASIKIEFSKKALSVSANGGDNDFIGEIGGEFKPYIAAFDPRFVAHALKSIGDCDWKLIDDKSPLVMQSGNHTEIVMPMRMA